MCLSILLSRPEGEGSAKDSTSCGSHPQRPARRERATPPSLRRNDALISPRISRGRHRRRHGRRIVIFRFFGNLLLVLFRLGRFATSLPTPAPLGPVPHDLLLLQSPSRVLALQPGPTSSCRGGRDRGRPPRASVGEACTWGPVDRTDSKHVRSPWRVACSKRRWRRRWRSGNPERAVQVPVPSS